jgi:hypothetical protein
LQLQFLGTPVVDKERRGRGKIGRISRDGL